MFGLSLAALYFSMSTVLHYQADYARLTQEFAQFVSSFSFLEGLIFCATVDVSSTLIDRLPLVTVRFADLKGV